MEFMWLLAICLVRLEFIMRFTKAEVIILSSSCCMQAMKNFVYYNTNFS